MTLYQFLQYDMRKCHCCKMVHLSVFDSDYPERSPTIQLYLEDYVVVEERGDTKDEAMQRVVTEVEKLSYEIFKAILSRGSQK